MVWPDDAVASVGQERVAALVRVIRRIYGRPLEAFHVSDIHDFARRLVAEGVRATEDEP